MKCCVCGKELEGLVSLYNTNWTCSNCTEDKTDVLHCETGCKVEVSTFDAGYDIEQERMKQLFEIGKIYTIDNVYVYGYNTYIYLKEFPNEHFNSVFFRRVE